MVHSRRILGLRQGRHGRRNGGGGAHHNGSGSGGQQGIKANQRIALFVMPSYHGCLCRGRLQTTTGGQGTVGIAVGVAGIAHHGETLGRLGRVRRAAVALGGLLTVVLHGRHERALMSLRHELTVGHGKRLMAILVSMG